MPRYFNFSGDVGHPRPTAVPHPKPPRPLDTGCPPRSVLLLPGEITGLPPPKLPSRNKTLSFSIELYSYLYPVWQVKLTREERTTEGAGASEKGEIDWRMGRLDLLDEVIFQKVGYFCAHIIAEETHRHVQDPVEAAGEMEPF